VRGTKDAVRSVKRYLDQILNQGPPPLGEVWWGPDVEGPPTYRWTHRGMVPGCLDVDEAAWRWLKLSRRGAEMPVGGPGALRWAHSRLVYDPTPELSSVGLPTTGEPVTTSSLKPTDGPWEVALWAEAGTLAYPFCVVTLSAAAGTSGPALYYDVTQPMAIECYPTPPTDAEEAIHRAAVVQDALLEGFRGQGVAEGRPVLIPLYDYDGVPLAEGVEESRIESDFMRVLDFSPRVLAHPQDPTLVRVVADLRVGWRKSRPEAGKRPVESVVVTTEAWL
jgi:hypothetical protein